MFTIAKLLKDARLSKNLSLKEVSEAIGIDYTLFSRYENGSRTPSKNQLETIANYYGIDAKKLVLQWLSEKIYQEIKDEEYGLEALQLAESRVAYKSKSFNNTTLIKQADELKALLDQKRPLSKAHLAKLMDYYKVEYTYDSNRIEGNTMTLKETALVIEKGLTISGKSVREHFETVNHAEAIDMLFELVENKTLINEYLVKQIHGLILRGIDKENAGKYRDVNVRISGSKHFPPEPYLLSKLMEDYFLFYNENKSRMHPIVLAAEMHERLVTIHPFIDGNGRTARLVMNLVLMQAGYPITNISSEKDSRLHYYETLEVAQTKHNKAPFIEFIFNNVIYAITDFLKMAT